MTTAFNLLGKVLSGRLPPKVLFFGLCNTLNRNFRPGQRRFEFERLYLESDDPWKFASSDYEREKYERTLAHILEHRSGDRGVLELGCSIGVFSALLAPHFAKVVASDFSAEALVTAARLRGEANIRWVRGYIQSLDLCETFDVIVCAEVLYYLRKLESTRTCRMLDRHLGSGGILIVVSGISTAPDDAHHFTDWEPILSRNFTPVARERVVNGTRPYEILIFRKHLS